MSAPAFNMRPSSLHRTMRCTFSVLEVPRLIGLGLIPEDNGSEWAAEGSAAHAVREMCLSIGMDPVSFVGQWIEEDGYRFLVTEEMAEYLMPGIDWIREQTGTPLVETRVDLSAWLPGQKGTIDAGWMSADGRWIGLSDLKFGMMFVSSRENSQQLAYGLGLWDHFGRPDIEGFIINIDQPRAFGGRESLPEELTSFFDDDPGRGMKYAVVPLAEVLAFGDKLRNAWNDVAAGRTVYAPSADACAYCPARAANPATGYMGCPAYNNWMEQVMLGAFDFTNREGPVLPAARDLTPERRAFIAMHHREAIKWLKGVFEASTESALQGNPDPGTKLVMGPQGDRYFRRQRLAEMVLVSALGADAYKPKSLIGITAAQSALKPGRVKKGNPRAWELLQKLVDRPEGKPILVPENDERAEFDTRKFDFDDQF